MPPASPFWESETVRARAFLRCYSRDRHLLKWRVWPWTGEGSWAALKRFPLGASALNSQAITYNRAHHRFCLLLAGATLALIVAGALVTSNDAGLAVPDWPTSFGSLYKIPPMVGGVKFEHGHRMIAEFIGLLTIVLAVWTQRVERRRWMRVLGWTALATVIAQGVLGGITVKFFLPPWVSTAHATLAQTFFCIVVSFAVFTGKSWTEDVPTLPLRIRSGQDGAPAGPGNPLRPGVRTLALLAAASVYVQLILGAAFRHSGLKLLPHLISAVVVTSLILWTVTRVLSGFASLPQLRRPATFLLGLLFVQLSLGFAAYLTRVEWGKDAPQPKLPMVLSTVAHVAVGALLLATTVLLAIQAQRYTAGRDARHRVAKSKVEGRLSDPKAATA